MGFSSHRGHNFPFCFFDIERLVVDLQDTRRLAITNGNCLRMGRMTSSYPHGLQGWMDCINYWNNPLTEAERTWLYNSGAGRAYSEMGA